MLSAPGVVAVRRRRMSRGAPRRTAQRTLARMTSPPGTPVHPGRLRRPPVEQGDYSPQTANSF